MENDEFDLFGNYLVSVGGSGLSSPAVKDQTYNVTFLAGEWVQGRTQLPL